MDSILTTVSTLWDKFANGGAYAIQQFIYALAGWEISEMLSLALFIGLLAILLLWLVLRLKRPGKTTYLMECGRRYNRH